MSLFRKKEEYKKEQTERTEPMADQAAAPVVEPTSTTPRALSVEEIMQLLAFQNQQNQENMAKLIHEMKKPTEEEQRKLDEQKQKDLRSAKSRAEVGAAELKRRTAKQLVCAHKRPDGSWAASGQQVTGNEFEGKVFENCAQIAVVMCLQCQKPLYVGPTNPMFAQGLPVNVTLHNVQ